MHVLFFLNINLNIFSSYIVNQLVIKSEGNLIYIYSPLTPYPPPTIYKIFILKKLIYKI